MREEEPFFWLEDRDEIMRRRARAVAARRAAYRKALQNSARSSARIGRQVRSRKDKSLGRAQAALRGGLRLARRHPRPSLALGAAFGLMAASWLVLAVTVHLHLGPGKTARGDIAAGPYGFQPVVPAGKKLQDLGQTMAASFDKNHKTLVYQDSFAGNKFTLTEQPLSSNFASEREAAASVIDAFGAGQSFKSTKGQVYLAQDSVTTSQVALLIYKKVAVYIKTETAVDPYAWQLYIDSLQIGDQS